LTWKDSLILTEIKGSAIATTYDRRKALNEEVHVFGNLEPIKDRPDIVPSSWNPLLELNPESSSYAADIRTLIDGLVRPDPKESKHWSGSLKEIFGGVVAFVIWQDGESATLYKALELINNGNAEQIKELAAGMVVCGEASGLAKTAGNRILYSLENSEFSSVRSTINTQLGWLGDPPVREMLSTSDFRLSDLKKKKFTIFLFIPTAYLGTYAALLRLITKMIISVFTSGERLKYKLLLLMDEFYAIGALDELKRGIAVLSEYLKIQILVQDITQIKELYPDCWETFITQSGMVQIFGVSGETAKYFAEKLGSIRTTTESSFTETKIRTAQELEEELTKSNGLRQIVFRKGKKPALLNRPPYWKVFPRKSYGRDTYYEG